MQGSVAADSVHNHDHNLDPDYREKLKNVDHSRTHLNEVLVADDLREVYRECFDEAVAAYNERQRRADRKIADYYDKISASKQEHIAYEIVVQLGDRKNNSASSLDDAAREQMSAVYHDYLTRFQDRYGHVLRVFEAVIHFDEATPHMHLAYVPVAHNSGSRGLAVKNSHRQAMQELGFYVGSKEERVDFYHDAQDLLTEVMASHGIEREASRYDRANRGDMTQEEYVEFSENQEKLIESREKLSEARSEAEAWLRTSEIVHKQANKEEARRDEARSEVSKLTGEVSDLEGRKAAIEKEIEGLKIERADLRTERDELSVEVSNLRRKKGTLEAAVEKLGKVLDDLIGKIKAYLPDPLLPLVKAFEDDDMDAVDRWHESMNDAAIAYEKDVPSILAETADCALTAKEEGNLGRSGIVERGDKGDDHEK